MRATGRNAGPTWRRCALREHDSGRHRYGHVQVSGLLLELAWFANADGDHATTRTAMERLSETTQDLAPHDRAYFVQALKQLAQATEAAP